MKNNNRILSLSLSLCIVLSLLAQVFAPVISFADDGVIYISDTEDFIEFAENCSYDGWSVGKEVVLTADISLLGIDFEPIGSFSGSFDGAGYTVKDINIVGAYAPAGLFATLAKGAIIKNLNVIGTVTPAGDKGVVGGIAGENYGEILNCTFFGTVIGKTDVGGIAGINKVSGRISDCTVSGEVLGENRTGGISGTNDGLISSSKNEGKVNTIGVTPSISLSDINISLTLDITKLPSLNNSTMNDTGGIAGYSTGIIMGCENMGRVGYPHIGYNVGGIVGRSNGHLISNINHGVINGRKDVGGIVGQMEPHISYELSPDLLAALKAELDEMSRVAQDAVGTTGSGIPNISSRLDSILNNLDLATNSLNDLMNGVGDYGDSVIGEVNRISLILDEVISQLSGITDAIPELSGHLNGSLSELESAIENIKDFSSLNAETISDIKDACESISSSFSNINLAVDDISSSISAFENALTINDKEAAKASLNKALDGISSFIENTDGLAKSLETVAGVLDNAAWTGDVVEQINSVIGVFGDITDSFEIIYDATTVVKENIELDWDKFLEAEKEIIATFRQITNMTAALKNAVDLITLGTADISKGFKILDESININDPDEAKKALNQIVDGVKMFAEGTAELSKALDEFSDNLESIDSFEKFFESFAINAVTFKKLADSIEKISESLPVLADNFSILIENFEIDFNGIEEGGAIVIGGMDKIADAMPQIKKSVTALSSAMITLEKAVNAIDAAIEIKDEVKISEAFDAAYSAIGDIINSTSELSDIFEDFGNTLEDAKIWGDSLTDSIVGVSESFSAMTEALLSTQNGIDELRNNISFNMENAEGGLGLIKDGLADFGNASSNLKDCFDSLSNALGRIDSGSEALNGAMTDLGECLGEFKKAITSITSISEDIGLLIGYLKGVDPIQLPALPESITATANNLFAYISAIESDLKMLNASMTDLGSELVGKIGEINVIFHNISDNIVSTIYGLNNGESIDNKVSEEEIDSVTNGKVFSCTNIGDVNGDVNVGGISGAMGLEYALDPEDDMTGELTITQKKQYKLKAVIHASKNYGNVTAKKDCAGGIVGKMDIGLIYGGESYCEITSQTGNYVGGIAGISAGLISQCFTKSALYGGKYVGGIIGSGVTEDLLGDSSVVRNCYSMVEIRRYTQYAGAISGVNAGQFSENLFVSDILRGIDRVSYQGKAEPILYEELIKRRSIPDEFYHFVLNFYADGELLYSTDHGYGASFDASIFPEIPEKEGHYGYWDITSLTNLVFDTDVSVVYVPYVKALESEEKRESGREIFFVRGEFTKNDAIKVVSGCDTSGLTLEEKFFTKDSLVESWVLTIPKDNLDTNTVHFLPENEHARIFIKVNGVWEEANATEFGSYLTFETNQDTVEIAVLEHEIKMNNLLMVGGIALLVLAIIVILIVVLVKKAKKKNNKKDGEKISEEQNSKDKDSTKVEKRKQNKK